MSAGHGFTPDPIRELKQNPTLAFRSSTFNFWSSLFHVPT